MKRFWKAVAEWKTGACLLYTASMTIYLVFCTAFGQREVSRSMLWMLLAVSAAATLLQGVCFSQWVFRRMRYTLRSVLFVALFLPLLSLVAWKGAWFPVERPGAWALFLGIFFAIFLVMTVGFELYYRAAGKKYDGLIGQYRKEKEAAEQNTDSGH